MEPNKDLGDQLERATALAGDEALIRVFNALASDPAAWDEASADPREYFQSNGVEVPGDLRIALVKTLDVGHPVDDYQFFTIRMTKCRTVWIVDSRHPEEGYHKEEVCFGFEIVPHPLPGGPIA